MEYVLKTNNLSKRFGSMLSNDNLSITVKKGDIYGFIGKNGAGKTTFMKMVLGILIPTEGEIKLFNGESLDKARNKIGSLIESPGIYKNLSAYENLRQFSMLTKPVSKKEIKEIISLVGLDKVGNKKVGNFSLGMKQRLGIGIALLGNPEFLILDEPINGLDPTGIREVRDLLLKLNKEKGITILISSHLLEELSKLVTTYGIINNGKLIEEISAEELDKKCINKLKICVDNSEKGYRLLKDNISGISCEIVDDHMIYVFSHMDKSSLINRILVENHIDVSVFEIESDGLENYFLERIG